MRAVSSAADSDLFSPREKLAIAYAEKLTRTPPEVDDAFFSELRRHFDERELVELTATIAWENYLGRFNIGLGVEPQGFSEGAFCIVPERSGPVSSP